MRSIVLTCLLTSTIVLAACSTPGVEQSPHTAIAGAIRVDGDVSSKTLAAEDLEQLQPTDVSWTHKGETRSYRAVSLESVIRTMGLDPGSMEPGVSPSEKRAGWKYAVVATASDGFQAVFSVPEVFHGMGHTDAYVAYRENNGPIDKAAGPFRMIVPTDGEGSRSVRNLERLTIIDLRRVVPAQRARS